MSEFSTSYHLITKDQENAVNLLKNADLHGYVFPEKNGVVTFVIEQDIMSQFECSEQLLRHNTKPLVFYVNGEDHGWSFELFDKNECIASYSSSINEDEIMEGFDIENPELFVPRDDISLFVYEGSFQMERVKKLLEDSVDSENKIAIIQKAKAIVDSQNGISKEVTLDIKKEAMEAYEFTKKFGIFFFEWISYHYLEIDLENDLIFDYGRLGKFPLIKV